MRPVIGLTMHQFPEYLGFKLRRSYCVAVEQAGGIPLLLPATTDPALMAEQIALLDGLILTGGGDFPAELFGELPEPVVCDSEPGRDEFELPLIRLAWEQRLPLLGICRGMQAINIALGGSIYQDLAYAGLDRIQHQQSGDMKHPSHPVRIIDERLAALLGGEQLRVNSSHHQAVKRLAEELTPAAVAPDGVIEAYRAKDSSRYAVGMQWHPEELLPICGIFRDMIQYITEQKTGAEEEQDD